MKTTGPSNVSYRQRSFVQVDKETVLKKNAGPFANGVDHKASLKENLAAAKDEFSVGMKQILGSEVDTTASAALMADGDANRLEEVGVGLRNLGRSAKDGIVDAALHAYSYAVMAGADLLTKPFRGDAGE